MLSYIVAAAFTATTILIAEGLARAARVRGVALRAGVWALGLAIWIVPSLISFNRYPPMDGALLWQLADERYQRRRFVVYQHQYALRDLVWLRTGGPRTELISDILPEAPRDLKDAPEFLACAEHWTSKPLGGLPCEGLARQLVDRGHWITTEGDGFVIVRLNRDALVKRRGSGR
jgi:hypothetical protein